MNRKTTLYFILPVVAAAVYAFLVLVPQYREIAKLSSTESDLLAEQKRLRMVLRSEIARERQRDDLEAQFAGMLYDADEAAHVSHMLDRFRLAAAAAELEIKNINPLARQVTKEGWVRYPVQVSLRCDIASFTDFLFRLSNDPTLFHVQRWSLRTAKSARELRAEIVVSSFAWTGPQKPTRRAKAARTATKTLEGA